MALVGVAGFEPTTSWSQTRRDTGLRYTPKTECKTNILFYYLQKKIIYKKTIFDYITEKHPDLLPLYDTIYNKKERSYWSMLDAQMRQFCQEEGLLYVRDDDSIKRPFNDPPIVVNYFFNEEIIPRPKCRRTGNQNYIVTCRKLEVVEVRL